MAIDGQTGAVLWEFDKRHAIQMDVLSVYAAQFVHDLNGDGVPDVFAVHGGDELSDPGKKSTTDKEGVTAARSVIGKWKRNE